MKYNAKYDRYVTKGGLVYRYNAKKDRLIQCKLSNNSCGYLVVGVMKPKKTILLVHRIVYETFVGEIPEDYQIDHIDTNKENNSLENLRCVTPKENTNNILTINHKLRSEFGKKYFEHFGYSHKVGKSHYCREWRYYIQHKKCSWE